jgi:hypothetical protein
MDEEFKPMSAEELKAGQRALDIADQRRMLSATSSAGLKTADDVRNRLLEYITYSMEKGAPTKLKTLNKRFGVVSSRLGLPIRVVIDELVERGEARVYEHSGNLIIFPAAWIEEFDAHWETEDEPHKKPAAFSNILSYAK